MHISRRKLERKPSLACRRGRSSGVTVILARAVRLGGDSRPGELSDGYNIKTGVCRLIGSLRQGDTARHDRQRKEIILADVGDTGW
jgi:hypothetical protein